MGRPNALPNILTHFHMKKNRTPNTITLIILTLLATILISNSCTRKLLRSVELNRSQTTTIIDTLVRIVPDSSMLRAYFKCDSNNRVTLTQIEQLQSENSSNVLLIDSLGKIEVKTRWRTQVIERERVVRDTITKLERVNIEKRIPYIPSFVWWTISALALTGLALGYLVFRLIRRRNR